MFLLSFFFSSPFRRYAQLLCLLTGVEMSAELADIVISQNSPEPSFRNHVQPILTKAGCNMGACHGAGAGKNGFYLSLRGYNDDADWTAITRAAAGRRIDASDPGRSLLLLKATGTLPHKGGKRFETDSPEYQTLARWIAAGSPAPKMSDLKLERLEVLPPQSMAKLGETKQIKVLAHFGGNRIEDVTRWAKFTSAQETVAQVDDSGLVRVIGSGAGAISVWYLSQIAVAHVTVPWTNPTPTQPLNRLRSRGFIDDQINAKLVELNLPPSPPADDATFIRRAHLDTLGTLPTKEDVRSFLADCRKDGQGARDALVERLLRRPEFVDYWTYKWSDLLLVNSRTLPPKAARAYHRWIRQQVERNTPWNVIARDLVLAKGSNFENGAANFFILHDDPRTMAETVTQTFMGMSVGCARCHNHPSERWTNDDYFAYANLFARVRSKNSSLEAERILVSLPSGDLAQPRTGRPQKPRPLGGKTVDDSSLPDRREAVVDWLTNDSNPYFAKAIVNRVWANFFGIGLVERVDDLRVSNPSSNEALFKATADFLIRQRYDLKSLMREILRSEAYRRSSESLPGNREDTRFYSRYHPHRLMAEVILDAYAQVTGVPTDFKRSTENGDNFALTYPKGTRALELPDSQIASYFLKSFGKPDRLQNCDCERSSEPSVAQVLHIANGSTLNDKLRSEACLLSRATGDLTTDIEDAYLRAYSRFPTQSEQSRIMEAVKSAPISDRHAVLEDLYWALLSSKEFLFNH